MKLTGGVWDKSQRHVYFLASNVSTLEAVGSEHVLIAVNELTNEKSLDAVDSWIESGKKVLIDSGIFALTMVHSRAHGVPMDIALGLAPGEIDGFDELWTRYLSVIKRVGDRAWGYIELDQGGIINKRKTRQKLEDLGVNPMPVYHPLNDGFDYFDELAEGYDRMCMGNIVQASKFVRLRLVHSLWERHRKYPDLWVHMLGMTPSQLLNAFPYDSADSSTWLNVVRWGGYSERAMLKAFSDLPRDFQYALGNREQWTKSLIQSSNSMEMHTMANRHWLERVESELGVAAYPALTKGEK